MLNTFEIKTNSYNEMLDITGQVQSFVNDSGITDGLCIVYVPHTTAGVTINENADPSVKHDILMESSKFVIEHDNAYRHSEGHSTGHIKSTLFGSSINIIVDNGRLLLGTWQCIFFCEFDGPRRRRVHIKLLSGWLYKINLIGLGFGIW